MWNACEFSSHGICHNSASSPKKHQDKEAWFLWYNLYLESCMAPLVASLMASFLVHGIPMFGATISTGCGAHLSKSGTRICLGTALWAFENMGFNEVKLTTCYHGQPSCSLIRLKEKFYSLSTSKGNKKHVRVSPGSQVTPCPSQVCSYFIYTSRIIWNTVQYPESIPIFGTNPYFFQIIAGNI